LVAPDQTTFYKPFLNLSIIEDEVVAEELRSEAMSAIQTSIIPGFEELVEYLQARYLPATRPGGLRGAETN